MLQNIYRILRIHYDQQTNNIIIYNSNSNCVYNVQMSNASQNIFIAIYTHIMSSKPIITYNSNSDNHKHAAICNIDELSNLS